MFQEEFTKLTISFSLSLRDLMVILARCCNEEEKARILARVWKVADEMHKANPNLPTGEEAIPTSEPSGAPTPRQGEDIFNT